MAIKIEMLRCFATVARSGNLADAADKLSRTPSAVSMMLKQFEEHLGAPLFESERKSKLTALGAFALENATREIEHFERTVTTLEAYAKSQSGYVRVAAVPSVAASVLPTVVHGFLRDRPGVHVDIRDMDSAAVIRELERERVDIGLATGTGAGPGIERAELFTDAFGVICRRDHPLADAVQPLAWEALAPWPFIANGICAHIRDAAFREVFGRSQLMVRNTTSLLAMVRAGVGITVLPRLTVGEDADILFLPVADRTARRGIDILRRAHVSFSPAARAFAAAVRQAATGNGN